MCRSPSEESLDRLVKRARRPNDTTDIPQLRQIYTDTLDDLAKRPGDFTTAIRYIRMAAIYAAACRDNGIEYKNFVRTALVFAQEATQAVLAATPAEPIEERVRVDEKLAELMQRLRGIGI